MLDIIINKSFEPAKSRAIRVIPKEYRGPKRLRHSIYSFKKLINNGRS